MCDMRKLKSFVRDRLNRLEEFRIGIKEYFSNRRTKKTARSRLERKILLSVHSIEKSMGLRDFQPGHSVKDATHLLYHLNIYLQKQYPPSRFAFKEGLAALREYIRYQQTFDVDHGYLSAIEKEYRAILKVVPQQVAEDAERYRCRSILLDADMLNDQAEEYERFVASRHSVRMFSPEAVPQTLIARAVRLANYAPSACNRQPNRVYFINAETAAKRVADLITGNKGFDKEIRNFILVTVERSMFAGDEQFQWYINGGIYLESLVLSLHALKLATCIMQWRAFYKTERQLKALCRIGSNEAIVAVIGVGFYERETKVIAAQRMSDDDNLIIV